MRHPLETSVAMAAAMVGVAFGLSTWERWLARRRRHELAWTVALAMFAVAAAALAVGAQAGWSGPVFRTFYLFGAIADVPVLAVGSVYLLAGRRPGDLSAVFVLTFCAFAAGVIIMAPFRVPLPVDELVQGSRVFGPMPRILAAAGSAGAAAVIFGGAVWSGARVRRHAEPRRLLWSNGLIALGTLILGASGTLNSVFGAMTAFAVTLLAGIVVLFAGFLVATSIGGRPTAPAIAPAEPWLPPVRSPTRLRSPEGPGARGGRERGRRAAPDAAASRPDHEAVPAPP